MTRFDPSYLWVPIHATCQRCERCIDSPLGTFIHDVQCWSWRTAFYNLWCRVQLVFGLIELVEDHSDEEWFGETEW